MTDSPFAARLEIDRTKLTGYLLSTAHPVGRSKARFFARLGFFPADANRLDQALRDLAREPAGVEAQDTPFGKKYIVDGELIGPRARAGVRTVWIMEQESGMARFVTAYPRSAR